VGDKNNLKKIMISLPKVCHDKDLSASQIKMLKSPQVGGVLLFSDNFDENLSQVAKLIQALKAINPDLILAIDHEGGAIWRFSDIFRSPAAKFYGDLYKKDPIFACDSCEKAAFLVAKDLKATGIDWCFAPVVDVHYVKSQIIGAKLRAFSEENKAIVDLAMAWLKGLNKAGIKGCLKHFPGHGRCELDSHVDYPEDNRDFLSWQNDLDIYRNILDKTRSYGLDYLIMIGHMRVSNLHLGLESCKDFCDSDLDQKKNCSLGSESQQKHNPGSEVFCPMRKESPVYSSVIIKKLLKQDLGYNGLVISDCLSMQAADAKDDYPNKIKRAHNAGCDWVIASGFNF
jgi:beta-N-acetylhexosaminidase